MIPRTTFSPTVHLFKKALRSIQATGTYPSARNYDAKPMP